MKPQLSKPQKSNPISRFQLASKSITQNIQASKTNKYKPPQYCQSCSKLNDSSVTFKPTTQFPPLSPSPSTDRLYKTKVINIKIDPTIGVGFSGILESQNLRLIELNRNMEMEREEIVKSVGKLVGQVRVAVENYDSNRAVVGLDSVMRVVSGDKMGSYIDDERDGEDYSETAQNNKIQYQVLEKSIQTIKIIIQKSSDQYFPLTKKTLRQKYYFSLEDFDNDVNNMESQAETNTNLIELFKIRVNDFIDEVINDKKGKRMGLLEEEFERLRLYVNILKEKIGEFEEERFSTPVPVEKYEMSVQKEESGEREKERMESGKSEEMYCMLLNQCLVIEEFMSQQEEQQ